MKKFERKQQERNYGFKIDYSKPAGPPVQRRNCAVKTLIHADGTQELVPIMPMLVRERLEQHRERHPNDVPKEKSEEMYIPGNARNDAKRGKRDRKLDEFYKTHVYTWVTPTKRAWVKAATNDPVEEEE